MLRLVMGHEGLRQLLQVAIEHFREIIEGEPDTVVGHAALGKVVGPDPLAPISRPDLLSSGVGDPSLLLGPGSLKEARSDTYLCFARKAYFGKKSAKRKKSKT